MAKRRSRGGDFQLLVAPVQWTRTMAIKRLFEDKEIKARIIGAGTAEAAISQLNKNDSYSAVLIDWSVSATQGLELACAVKEKGKPPVVAFQRHWPRDDIRRALQLGVDCLLLDPFTPEDLLRDLRSIKDTGESLSRKQILEEGGEALLEADSGLWDGQTDDWRERMMGLADQLSRPWSDDMSDRASHMEVSVRRKAQIDGLTPVVARAILEIIDAGRDRLPAIASRYRIPSSELVHILGAVERFAHKHGGTNSIPLLLDEVLKRDPNLAAATNAPKLMLLKRVARVVIRANGKMSRGRDALNDALNKFVGASPAVTRTLSAEDRYNLAVRLLMAENEQDAIDQASFLVLAHLVNIPDPSAIGEPHFDALAALFGLDGRHEGVDPKKLIRMMANLHPLPVLSRIELKRLQAYRDAMSGPMNPYPAVDSALEQLIKVARPLGPIDQKRLTDLSQAVRQELSVLVGPPAWRSLLNLFEHPIPQNLKALESRLTFSMGTRTERSRQLLANGIRELINVGRNAMDAARFADFCRQASAEPLSPDVIAEFAAETHDDFTPSKLDRTGAAEQRALIEQALSSFENVGIDLDVLRDGIPPQPWGFHGMSDQDMARMRVLSAALDGRAVDDQSRVLRRFLGQHKLHPKELEALQLMTGDGELAELVQSQFFDPNARYRDGFDFVLEEQTEAGMNDGFDYADEYDEYDDGELFLEDGDDDDFDDDFDDDDELDSIAGDLDGGMFDVGAEPPPRMSNPAQPVEVDLGLDELELELDLAGGVFELEESAVIDPEESFAGTSMDGSIDSSVVISRDRRWRLQNIVDTGRPRQTWNSTFSEPVTDDFPTRDEAPLRRRVSSPPQDAGEGDVDERAPGGSLSGFDLGGGLEPSSRRRSRRAERKREQVADLPLNADGSLDIVALTAMVRTGRLKEAARMLHACTDEIDGLAEGLNLVALHAFTSDRQRAAHMLWSKAEKLSPESPNILFNLARLRVQLGQYTEAKKTIETLLRILPHFTLARELEDVLNARLEG